MNIKRILCPIDFSEFNQPANEYASMLARSTGARIIYLHAYIADPHATPPEFFEAEKTEAQLRKKLEEFVTPVGGGVASSYIVDYGLAAERIVNYANNYDVDLIVIGTHGRTGLSRIFMGSVAEAVVRNADCPVLAIKADIKVAAGV